MKTGAGEIWFVYDGDCPFCRTAASLYKVKEAVGKLHIIDARKEKNHPVVLEIIQKRLSLDEGMIIKFNNTYYHGADALHIMALLGSSSDLLNGINSLLFRSKSLSKLLYPLMRGMRNMALRIKGITPINNLAVGEPIFKPVFGQNWEKLPPALQKHYANRPFTNDIVTVEGKLDITFSKPIQFLSPLLKLTGVLVPYQGKDIPVTVHFQSEENSNAFRFNRIFHFPNKPPHHFRSRMIPIKNGEVIEFMRGGVGWRMRYAYEEGKVKLLHKGYALRVFGMIIHLPFEIFLGRGYAEEEATGDNSFRMYMEMRHKLFGRLYSYSGEFALKEMRVI